MPGLPDMSLFGKPLGKAGESPVTELKFGIGGSLQGYFDELFRLNAGSGLFGIGGTLQTYFDELFFNYGGGLFGIGAGDPGSAFYIPWPDGIFGGISSANDPLIGF